MIPSNIERDYIIKAIQEIDSNRIPQGRASRKFFLIFEGKQYPPKYVLSLANKFASGEELDSSVFSGGQETNNFLKRFGFDIVEISSSRIVDKSISQEITSEKPQKGHDERCPECKKIIERMLKEIYGNVVSNYKFEVSTNVEDYKDFLFYQELKEILLELQKQRGHKDFVRTPTLSRCDFFVPNPGFIVEFDESQHFTLLRKISLQNYPRNLKLDFSLTKWIGLCGKINAKDNDPPFRDEQRAWYDTLRDFLPELKDLEPTVRLYSKEMQWCSLNPENPKNRAKFRELIENRRKRSSSWVATVVLQSNEEYSNEERVNVLSEVVKSTLGKSSGDGVILFPAGMFSAGKKEARTYYNELEETVKNILSKTERNIVVCAGIDGSWCDEDQYNKDQIGIAINKGGILSIGRKFHPTEDEKDYIQIANDHSSPEEGKSRIFSLNGKRYFLAVCYDGFGIKHNELQNPNVDIILDLVHGFGDDYGKGTPNFARHGLAGASNQWRCPVFAAAVFFKCEIHERWPSGVYWNKGITHSRSCTYKSISIRPINEISLDISEGVALIRIYNLEVI